MFCPKCGSQIPDGSKFCPKCGNQFAATPTAASQPTPRPVPKAGPRVAVPVGATPATDVLKIGRIVAGAVAVLAFFLPIVSIGASGFGVTASAMQMATGVKFLGASSSDPSNFLFLAVGVVALVLALLPDKKGGIGSIVGGAIVLVFVMLWFGQVNDQLGSFATLEIGFYLYVLAGIALIVLGALSLKKN